MIENFSARAWTPEEINDLVSMEQGAFLGKHPHRSPKSWYDKRRRVLGTARVKPLAPEVIETKRVGSFNWREANKVIAAVQELSRNGSNQQDYATVRIDVDRPIAVVALSDTHIGDYATDHQLLQDVTDEILSTPDLYVLLLGDLAQMAIKLRSVGEVSSNLLRPDVQLQYVESWIEELSPRILAATWDNHAVEREEVASGISSFASLLSKRFVYFNGIGHLDVEVGSQVYKLAVSHRFLGRSMLNPNHAPVRYLRMEGHDREIAIMGDYHVPGIQKFTHGATPKVAMNVGSFQTNSGYAKRFFSLSTHPHMPVLVLHPDRHLFTPFESLDEYLALRSLR